MYILKINLKVCIVFYSLSMLKILLSCLTEVCRAIKKKARFKISRYITLNYPFNQWLHWDQVERWSELHGPDLTRIIALELLSRIATQSEQQELRQFPLIGLGQCPDLICIIWHRLCQAQYYILFSADLYPAGPGTRFFLTV